MQNDAVEILLMYPTDVVKTRAQLATGKGVGMVEAFGGIIKNEGAHNLYRRCNTGTQTGAG